RRALQVPCAYAPARPLPSSRIHSRIWRQAAGLVRTACDNGIGYHARKADQDMESRLEAGADRSCQSRLARSRGRFRLSVAWLILAWLGSRFRGNDDGLFVALGS